MATDIDRYTQDNYAPLGMECDAPHLPIVGELPHGLEGTLYRNGPDPQFPAADPRRSHWFLGDGMIHAFTLRDGKASYRSRWVRTGKWLAENAAGHALGAGFGNRSDAFADTGLANTNIIQHAAACWRSRSSTCPSRSTPCRSTRAGCEASTTA